MSRLKYRCLILDHDDTTVDSTAHVHYPAFVKSMAELRPGIHMTQEEYLKMSCDPGTINYLVNIAGLSAQELALEHRQWLDYAADHIPPVYDGICALMCKQKEMGGFVCVVSQNHRENILRDYASNSLPAPDLIYGSDLPPAQQKPNAWPIRKIMEELSLPASELLVVDDLTLGWQMAQSAGVKFAAAGWGHNLSSIRRFWKAQGVQCYETPAALAQWLHDGSAGP